MSQNPEHRATAKALIESQLAAFSAINSIVTKGAGQAFSVTIAAARASTEACLATANECLAAKDARGVIALATALSKSNAERLTSYATDLMELRFTTRAELAKILTAQVRDAQSKLNALVDDVTRNSPRGADQVMGTSQANGG